MISRARGTRRLARLTLFQLIDVIRLLADRPAVFVFALKRSLLSGVGKRRRRRRAKHKSHKSSSKTQVKCAGRLSRAHFAQGALASAARAKREATSKTLGRPLRPSKPSSIIAPAACDRRRRPATTLLLLLNLSDELFTLVSLNCCRCFRPPTPARRDPAPVCC